MGCAEWSRKFRTSAIFGSGTTQKISFVSNQNIYPIHINGWALQNNVLELWSLFDFLLPGFLGDEAQFNRMYSAPILASGKDMRVDPERRKGKISGDLLRPLHKFHFVKHAHDDAPVPRSCPAAYSTLLSCAAYSKSVEGSAMLIPHTSFCTLCSQSFHTPAQHFQSGFKLYVGHIAHNPCCTAYCKTFDTCLCLFG